MPIIAYPLDPSTIIAERKPSVPERDQEADSIGEIAGAAKTTDSRYVYRIDRTKSFSKTQKPVDAQFVDNADSDLKIDDWIRLAEETFSSPSKRERGEKGSVLVVDEQDDSSSRAGRVPEMQTPARCLRGLDAANRKKGFTLLDYRNTQAEKSLEYFSKGNTDADIYKYKTIRSGDVLEVYEYEGLQVNKKGKPKKQNDKKEESTEGKTEDQIREIRKKSISRASKHIKRSINANGGKWGHELPKFLTLTFKDDITDFKTANYEFKKFHQRLSYRIGYKLIYTVVVQFQDGERKGGIKGGRGGVIHFHVVLYNMSFIPANDLSKIWGQGFIKINAIDNVDNLGAYVVGGYMCKTLDDPRYDGQKRYFSSRGLYESLEAKSALPIDLGEFTEDHKVYETSFDNEYTGVIHYKQYNLKNRIGSVQQVKNFQALPFKM